MQVFRKWGALFAILIVIGVNAAANAIPINGFRTGDLSDLNPTGFTPSGWVFSIWSVIYLGLLVYSVSLASGYDSVKARGDSVQPLFVLNAAANVSWIFLWHYRLVTLSLLAMFVLLGTLIAIHRRLRNQGRASTRQFICVDAPFSLYFGWITTATIANLAAAFFGANFYPFHLSMDQWALVSVVAAVATYVWMGAVTRDGIYCAVFIWASLGIYLKESGVSEPVKLAAATGAALLVLTVLWIVSQSVSSRSR